MWQPFAQELVPFGEMPFEFSSFLSSSQQFLSGSQAVIYFPLAPREIEKKVYTNYPLFLKGFSSSMPWISFSAFWYILFPLVTRPQTWPDLSWSLYPGPLYSHHLFSFQPSVGPLCNANHWLSPPSNMSMHFPGSQSFSRNSSDRGCSTSGAFWRLTKRRKFLWSLASSAANTFWVFQRLSRSYPQDQAV